MNVGAGTRLGPYEVLSPLGAGGMGEVYRARDTKLGREVAVKVLPDAFSSDSDRVSRLEREAQRLASLNHPNIATLHAFENLNGVCFLVMELIEGPTLEERLRAGPLPVGEALDFFRQVADALVAAHGKGVIHRDLKPGNLKIGPGGLAKILDFGLATTIVPTRVGDITDSPTASLPHTATGVIQGTAPYMSPEQAKGRPADERSDAFSFGVTLYEALVGRRAFPGQSVTEVLAAVLEREPDWSVLPPDTPDLVRFLLRRCLKKNPDDRLRDMGEAKAALGEAMNSTPSSSAGSLEPRVAAPRGKVRRRFALGLGAVVLIGLGVLSGRLPWKKSGGTSSRPVHRFQIEHKTGEAPSISPDGKHIAYVDGDRLWIRDLDRLDSREVPGSEKARSPFWAPDGRNVAFVADGFIKRAPIDAGPVRTVCELKPVGFLYIGSTWGPSGSIVVALGPRHGLFEVSSEGGDLRPVLKPDPAKGIFDFHRPSFLPDGRSILLIVHPERGTNYLAVFDGREVRRLLPESTPSVEFPVYSENGYILLSHLEGVASLHAIPFDASKLAVTGQPIRIADDASNPSVSADGVLVYMTGAGFGDLILVKRSGQVERTISSGHGGISFPRISPDGKRVLLSDQKDWNPDIWVEDIEQGTRVRLTTGAEPDYAGAWSASGERVAFLSGDEVVLTRADGSGQAERLPFRSNRLPETAPVSPDWSTDGRFLIYRSGGDLYYGDAAGKAAPVAFAKTPFTESEGRFSPDGQYVAYMSNESGRFEVYVRPFPDGDRRWTLSTNGGAVPRWSRRGDELFYVEGNALMAVPVSTRDGFRSSPPKKLFDAAAIGALSGFSSMVATYDPMPDGRAFVLARRAPGSTRIVIVENWAAELKQGR